MDMTPQEYQEYVKRLAPKSPTFKDTAFAFFIGGAICALGQLIQNGFLSLGLAKADAGTATSICLIFLSALLTGLNLYNSIARFAGAGTLVPITGFANSVVSPAIDFKSEGFITGMASKMFVVAGPVIVFGTLEWWENYWENPASGEKNNNTAGQLELKDLSWDNYNYVEENFSDNATALFGTKGVQLVIDGAKVTGVIAQDGDGNYLKINAKNGVVLAGGGFGGNKEMMDDLLPDIKRLFTKDEDFFAPFGRDGSTIQMGVWAGGRLEGDISTMNFDSMAVPDYLPGPLWVDENGQRFQNEAFAGPEINGFFMARAKRGNITSIYDSTYETQILRGFPGHQAFEYDMPAVVEAMKGNFEAAKAAGAEGANGWYCADTIEQLAEYIGVEPAALSATVEQYNKVCAEGYDSDFAKDPHFLNAVAKAPFYAHVTTPSLGFALVTTGGFVTTNDQQVLNEDYQPIEGLYASGNTCGMRFGPEYITPIPGVSIGMCLTLGRELGKYLAAK